MVKHLPAMSETWVRSLDREAPLEKEMATHSSTLAWKIPQTEEPDRPHSPWGCRVGHAEQLHWFNVNQKSQTNPGLFENVDNQNLKRTVRYLFYMILVGILLGVNLCMYSTITNIYLARSILISGHICIFPCFCIILIFL